VATRVRSLPLLLGLSLLACVRDPPAPPPRRAAPSMQRPAPPEDAALADDAGVEPAAPPSLAAVVALVRAGDRTAVRAAIERLPSSVQSSPEARFIAARVALDLGDPTLALARLPGLAGELPALALEVRRMEAAALAATGRHADARVAWEALAARGGGARDRTMAVLEAWSAGDRPGAAAAMRSWVSHPPVGIDRARAWRLAAEALDAAADAPAALEARRRLAIDEPDTAAGIEALAALSRGGHPLTAAQSMQRAGVLLERARHAEAIESLQAIPALEGRDEARRTHLLGRAFFGARGRYPEAHRWLSAAARNPLNSDRDEDAFMAARALSRADQDDDAVRAYDAVARSLRGRWSDEAAFRAAWLESRHARLEQAVSRWRAFLRDRPEAPSRLRVDAAWHLGWTLYSAGHFADSVEPLARSGDLATHHLERGRGRYWSAVAKLRAGDPSAAVAAWRELIQHRPLTWYAILAESRLRAQGAAPDPMPAPPEARPRPALTLPPRARWLAALGFDREAAEVVVAEEDALRATLPRDRADEVMAGAYLALGDARRAFVLSSRHADALDELPAATTRWIWDAGFPRPFAPLVEAAEDANGLPRDYLFAIMRQESGFNARDVSTARAIGLLQMVPPTSRRVAQELGIPFTEDRLFEPAYNIRVAGHYIGRLYRQYRSVLPRAIGSFNAGPGAMNRWMREHGADDVDAFVEHIPFDETRTYVRRVVQNLARYRYLYGRPERSVALPLRSDAAFDAIVDY
jgi:soluble lytic murein transglycosylase